MRSSSTTVTGALHGAVLLAGTAAASSPRPTSSPRAVESSGYVNNGTEVVGAPGPDWHIADTADFDGDGKNDILWRTDAGSLAIWEMDGTRVELSGYVNNGTEAVGAPGPDWHIADTADFNGDDKADILWRTDGGTLAIWEMDGTRVESSGYVNNGTERGRCARAGLAHCRHGRLRRRR